MSRYWKLLAVAGLGLTVALTGCRSSDDGESESTAESRTRPPNRTRRTGDRGMRWLMGRSER